MFTITISSEKQVGDIICSGNRARFEGLGLSALFTNPMCPTCGKLHLSKVYQRCSRCKLIVCPGCLLSKLSHKNEV